MRFPISVYTEDPEQTGFAEWHEVWYSFDSKAEAYILIEKHGWWDSENRQSRFKALVLGEPLKSEDAASTAMDARLRWLVEKGWIHKFTTKFEPHTGRFVPTRIS